MLTFGVLEIFPVSLKENFLNLPQSFAKLFYALLFIGLTRDFLNFEKYEAIAKNTSNLALSNSTMKMENNQLGGGGGRALWRSVLNLPRKGGASFLSRNTIYIESYIINMYFLNN